MDISGSWGYLRVDYGVSFGINTMCRDDIPHTVFFVRDIYESLILGRATIGESLD